MNGGIYADPLIYDILGTPGTAGEVDRLERISRAWGRAPGSGSTWLEPACGTGRHLRVIAGRGMRAVGFDIEPAMIDFAAERLRRRGLDGLVRVFAAGMADFESVAPGSIDFAFLPDNSLRHLESDDAVRTHFARVGRALAPGGVYAVGLTLSVYGSEAAEEDIWRAARGSCRVVQMVNYLPPGAGGPGPRTERVLSHLAITRPGGTEHRDAVYDLRCYDQRQWDRLVASSDLETAASLDGAGNLREGRGLAYQIEVLRPAR